MQGSDPTGVSVSAESFIAVGPTHGTFAQILRQTFE